MIDPRHREAMPSRCRVWGTGETQWTTSPSTWTVSHAYSCSVCLPRSHAQINSPHSQSIRWWIIQCHDNSTNQGDHSQHCDTPDISRTCRSTLNYAVHTNDKLMKYNTNNIIIMQFNLQNAPPEYYAYTVPISTATEMNYTIFPERLFSWELHNNSLTSGKSPDISLIASKVPDTARLLDKRWSPCG